MPNNWEMDEEEGESAEENVETQNTEIDSSDSESHDETVGELEDPITILVS